MNLLSPVLYCAPLRGVTDYIFRNSFEHHFGRFDYLLTPFIPTVKGLCVNPSHLRDVHMEHNDRSRVIPQIIGNNPSEFIVLARALHDMGYPVVNLNLGCPSPQITRKKRGSGLLPHVSYLTWFLDEVIPRMPCPLSIKTRLGYELDSDLQKLIPLFNQYPLHDIIIHARTGIQMYAGNVNLDAFEVCLSLSKHRIVYNGDITSLTFFEQLRQRFSTVNHWMIGRGVAADPFLLSAIRSGTYTKEPLRIKEFHDDIYVRNSRILHGPAHLLGKMKELWSYLATSFPEHPHLQKKILKTSSLRHYDEVIARLFHQ
jgi:tRNA-dihydrouridine synthase